MKVLSIKEALEKGLLRESAEGLIISDINNTINIRLKFIFFLLLFFILHLP